MSKLKKHAITVILVAIAIAVALMIWSRKAVAEQPPLGESQAAAAQLFGSMPSGILLHSR